MARFTLETKLSAVEYFLSGQGGLKATAKKFGTDHSAVRKWVAAYKRHGASGLKTRAKSNYTAEFKESVILYIQQYNVSNRQAAIHFDITSFDLISQWQRLYNEGGLQALKPRSGGRPPVTKPVQIPLDNQSNHSASLSHDELLAELEYLRAENACLKKLQALIQEKERLAAKKKQR